MYDATNVPATIEKIKIIISRCEAPDAPLNPNPEACKYCRAKSTCPELHREVELKVRDPGELTPELRAKRREFLLVVEAWAEQVREEDLQFIKAGGTIPGWELQARKGSRFICDPVSAWKRLEAWLPKEALVAATEIKLPKIEAEFVQAYADENGGKKQASELLRSILGDSVDRKQGYVALVKAKESTK